MMSNNGNPYRYHGKFGSPTKYDKILYEPNKESQINQNKAVADSKNNEELQNYHKQAIAELKKDSYEDGTYNIDTLKDETPETGYMVTFYQIGDNYSPDEYAQLVRMMNSKSDGKVYAGRFTTAEGLVSPEISWNFKSREDAEAIGRRFNQESIYECETGNFINTGGTGRRK